MSVNPNQPHRLALLSALTLFLLLPTSLLPLINSQASATQPTTDENQNATARALAVRTAERLLDQAKSETGTTKQKPMRKQALTIIQPFLIDPNQNDIAVWQAAGKVALANNNDNLTAFAFEAIKRLNPDYAGDQKLVKLMTQLNARPIDDRVKKVSKWRIKLGGLIPSKDDGSVSDPDEMWFIGSSYLYGIGVPLDDSEAMKWYRKAVEGGYTGAMYNLGWSYANGEGVLQDYGEAVKKYTAFTDHRRSARLTQVNHANDIIDIGNNPVPIGSPDPNVISTEELGRRIAEQEKRKADQLFFSLSGLFSGDTGSDIVAIFSQTLINKLTDAVIRSFLRTAPSDGVVFGPTDQQLQDMIKGLKPQDIGKLAGATSFEAALKIRENIFDTYQAEQDYKNTVFAGHAVEVSAIIGGGFAVGLLVLTFSALLRNHRSSRSNDT